MNTLSMESLLITEDEWIATEGLGNVIKKGASAIWTALKKMGLRLLEIIKGLIGKITSLFSSFRKKGNSAPPPPSNQSTQNSAPQEQAPSKPTPRLVGQNKTSNNERWKNVDRDQFVKSNAKYAGGKKQDVSSSKPEPPRGLSSPKSRILELPAPSPNRYGERNMVELRTIFSYINAIDKVCDKLYDKTMSTINFSFRMMQRDDAEFTDERRKNALGKADTENTANVESIKKISANYPPIQELIRDRKYVVEKFDVNVQLNHLKFLLRNLDSLKRSIDRTLQTINKFEENPNYPKTFAPAINMLLSLMGRKTTYINWQVGEIMAKAHSSLIQ